MRFQDDRENNRVFVTALSFSDFFLAASKIHGNCVTKNLQNSINFSSFFTFENSIMMNSEIISSHHLYISPS